MDIRRRGMTQIERTLVRIERRLLKIEKKIDKPRRVDLRLLLTHLKPKKAPTGPLPKKRAR